jgi:hypothetical protein
VTPNIAAIGPHDREDAALLAIELDSNAIDHVAGQSGLTLELGVSEDRLRIAVVDGSAVRPVVRELSLERPRGHTCGWSDMTGPLVCRRG